MGLLHPCSLVIMSFHILEIVLYDGIGLHQLHVENWALDIPSLASVLASVDDLASVLLSAYYALGITVMNKVKALPARVLWTPNSVLYSNIISAAMAVCRAHSSQIFQRGRTWIFRTWILPLLCKRGLFWDLFLSFWARKTLRYCSSPPLASQKQVGSWNICMCEAGQGDYPSWAEMGLSV